MFARIVPYLLIAALTACPMWCGMGLCNNGHCCTAVLAAQQTCARETATSCCCDHASRESKDQKPSPCPGDSNCQGICGGAVFEKASELDDARDFFFLPLIHGEVSAGPQLARHHAEPFAHSWQPGGGNYGRFVRTLHESFLC